MNNNLKVILFTRKELNSLKEIKFIKKNIKDLKIIYDEDIDKKNKLSRSKCDYIISYRSKNILKTNFLKKSRIAAINFHPGPPEFRGIGCANYAIFNKSKYYGFTVHIMDHKIDHGRILFCKKFKINYKVNLNLLLNQTYNIMGSFFVKFIKDIISNKFEKLYLNNKKTYKWSKKIYKKNDLEKLYKINLPVTKEKLDRILRSTIYKNYKPYIQIKNLKYYLDYEKI